MDSLEETIAVRAGENFDLEKVEHYLRDQIEDIGEGTLQVHQFPSGASNLTYCSRLAIGKECCAAHHLGQYPQKRTI